MGKYKQHKADNKEVYKRSTTGWKRYYYSLLVKGMPDIYRSAVVKYRRNGTINKIAHAYVNIFAVILWHFLRKTSDYRQVKGQQIVNKTKD